MFMCVWWWSVHCIIIVINCGLVRNNLVKLVKFMFCLFLLPFWWIKPNILKDLLTYLLTYHCMQIWGRLVHCVDVLEILKVPPVYRDVWPWTWARFGSRRTHRWEPLCESLLKNGNLQCWNCRELGGSTPQFIFEWKSALNFNPCAKFQAFRYLITQFF